MRSYLFVSFNLLLLIIPGKVNSYLFWRTYWFLIINKGSLPQIGRYNRNYLPVFGLIHLIKRETPVSESWLRYRATYVLKLLELLIMIRFMHERFWLFFFRIIEQRRKGVYWNLQIFRVIVKNWRNAKSEISLQFPICPATISLTLCRFITETQIKVG